MTGRHAASVPQGQPPRLPTTKVWNAVGGGEPLPMSPPSLRAVLPHMQRCMGHGGEGTGKGWKDKDIWRQSQSSGIALPPGLQFSAPGEPAGSWVGPGPSP
jgi:hypothetical protein